MLADTTTVMSFWPSDTVSLAIIGVVTMIVKDFLDRSRQAKADVKVESVVKTLAVQDEQASRREDKLDAVAEKVDHNTNVTVQTARKVEAVEAVVQAASDKGGNP